MKIRIGLTTLCTLVAVTLASCSFFQGRKSFYHTHQQLFLQNPCPPVSNPFFQSTRNYSSFSIPSSKPPKKKEEERTIDGVVKPKEKKDPLEPITLLGIRDLLIQRKGSEAAAQSQRILDENPNHLMARYTLAIAYDILDKDDDAIKEFDKILKADPEFDPVMIYLTEISRQIFETIFKEKCHEKGLRTYRYLLNLVESPGARTVFESWMSSVNFKAGREFYKEGKFGEAQKYLQTAAKENPSNFDICRKLGICSIHTRDFSMAASTFERLDKEDINEADRALMFYAKAMSTYRKKRIALLEQAHESWPGYELELLRSCFDEMIGHYLKNDGDAKLEGLLDRYPRSLEFAGDKKGIMFHAALFGRANRFFTDVIEDKEIGVVYFETLYRYFKEKKQIANASRSLYGRYLCDNDEAYFGSEYTSLGDHLIPKARAKVVLSRFFEDRKE